MAAHALHAPSELNLCFGLRTHMRAHWDSLNIEWRSFSLSLSFSTSLSLSLRKSGSGCVPSKRRRARRGEGRVIFRYLLQLHRRWASVPVELGYHLLSAHSLLPPAPLCGWAGLAAATACYGQTGWAGRPSMADVEELVFIPAPIILWRSEAVARILLNSRIKYSIRRYRNILFILYLCSIIDYFLFFHFTRVCPLCVCLNCSLWLPWRLCHNEMKNSCFQGAAIMYTPPAVIYPSQGCKETCRKGYRVDTIGGMEERRRRERWRQRERCQTQMCIFSLRNAMSGESVKEESERENSVWDKGVKKKREDYKEKSQMQQYRPNTCDREKIGTSEDEMDINTLNSCPAALREPKKAWNWSQIEQNLIAFPSPSTSSKSSSIPAPS